MGGGGAGGIYYIIQPRCTHLARNVAGLKSSRCAAAKANALAVHSARGTRHVASYPNEQKHARVSKCKTMMMAQRDRDSSAGLGAPSDVEPEIDGLQEELNTDERPARIMTASVTCEQLYSCSQKVTTFYCSDMPSSRTSRFIIQKQQCFTLERNDMSIIQL